MIGAREGGGRKSIMRTGAVPLGRASRGRGVGWWQRMRGSVRRHVGIFRDTKILKPTHPLLSIGSGEDLH